ncbi:MAG: GHKL domain-containing protein [Butyrivibrio sp.]|nr:GHKL domain-containing protein [Butyrivibrio sp.]
MSLNTEIDSFRQRFKYNAAQLIAFEKDPAVVEQKIRTAIILLSGFIIYTLIAIYPCIQRKYYHGAITNSSIIILFSVIAYITRRRKNHVNSTIIGSFSLCGILFFHFIMETNWTFGMDAFWLFILILPFITDYIAGVLYGSVAALSGLFLSLLLFKTPLLGYLQPYGSNMVQWFSVIYVVVMFAAAVIEYELTAYQIDKKISDEKIAYFQRERTQRLREQLAIYESNDQTIRKYRHDIRHHNRVLAGFIKDKEYEKAASYLEEYDSKLEEITAVSFCDNKVANELLSIYNYRCHKMGFKLRVRANLPERFPIEEIDLTSLLANALENGVEAQSHIEESHRGMMIDISYDGRKLKLLTKNPVSGIVEFSEGGTPISTRAIQSGIGTQQIKAIAEKYGGIASFTQEKNIFIVKAVMTCM